MTETRELAPIEGETDESRDLAPVDESAPGPAPTTDPAAGAGAEPSPAAETVEPSTPEPPAPTEPAPSVDDAVAVLQQMVNLGVPGAQAALDAYRASQTQ